MDFHVTIALLLMIYTQGSGSATPCLSYADPKNGYVTCDSLFHLFCSPECHPGYRFAAKPAVVYMCGPVTGEWFTYPVGSALPWPDCIPEDRSDNTIHEELAKKREEITRYITDSHTGIPTPHSQAKRIDPEERYHHLFNYIERAQKAYEYREAIDKETEKLKQEHLATKGDIAAAQSNHYGYYAQSSNLSKMPLSYGNNVVARKDNVSENAARFVKGNSQDQSPVAQNAKIQRHNNTMGYDRQLPPTSIKIPEIIDRGNGFSPQKNYFEEKLIVSSFQPNSQTGLKNARITMGNRADKNASPFKENSNFVLKILNNEEFKDLHYLDEHVRLNRDAQLQAALNRTKSVAQKDSPQRYRTSKGDDNQHLASTTGVTVSQNDLKDNLTVNSPKEAKELEDLSGHIVPIVMSRTSLVDSVTSLLNKDDLKDRSLEKNKSISNLQNNDDERQRKDLIKFENKAFVSANYLSFKNDGNFSMKKSKIQANQNQQNILGSSDVLKSSTNMKDLYESWLKNHGKSMKLYSKEPKKKNIASETKPVPWKQEEPITVQNITNVPEKYTRPETETQSFQGTKESGKKQQVKEHIFYFPVKKDTLFEILNETNAIP